MPDTNEHYCVLHCRKMTTWTMGRTRERCVGCGTEFPCARCRHFDCEEARGERVADASGVLKLVPKTAGAAGAATVETSNNQGDPDVL